MSLIRPIRPRPLNRPHTRFALALALLLSQLPPCLTAAPLSEVAAAFKPEGPWKTYPTRTLASLPAAATCQPDTGLNQYGGLLARKTNATGFFYPAKVDGRWWLVDPSGCLFLHRGVASVSLLHTPGATTACQEKFGSESNWASATTALLREHGFTSVSAWSDTSQLRQVPSPLVYTRIWNFMSSYGSKRGGTYQQSGHIGYPNDCIFVFDPEFETFCDQHARQLAASKDDPWLLGHFSDNELPFPRGALTNYLRLPEKDPGHEAALAWVRSRHGANASLRDITPQDQDDFLAVVVGRYYRIVSQAIKKHDPNHLYLGSRIHGRATRVPQIFRAAGPYVDVLSVNLYQVWTPGPEQFAMWEHEADRPVLITEWYAKGMDAGMANTTGAGWTVKTQADRGRFYQNFTLGLLASKTCVGWDWFKYTDNDPTARGVDPSNIDSNKGIVNNRYAPYPELLEAMKQLNQRACTLRDYFSHSPAQE